MALQVNIVFTLRSIAQCRTGDSFESLAEKRLKLLFYSSEFLFISWLALRAGNYQSPYMGGVRRGQFYYEGI